VIIADQNGKEMWETQIVEMKSLLFLKVWSRRVEVKDSYSRCYSTTLNDQRQQVFWIWLPFYYSTTLLILKGTSQLLVQVVSVVIFFKTHLFVIYSQRHVLEYTTKLPAFQPITLSWFASKKHRRSGLCTGSKYMHTMW